MKSWSTGATLRTRSSRRCFGSPPSGSRSPREEEPVLEPAGVRVLSPWEAQCLDPGAHGYLLRLLTLGIVDGEQLDRILSRLTPLVAGRIQISEVKSIAAAVVFNLGPEDIDDEYYQVLDDEIQTT